MRSIRDLDQSSPSAELRDELKRVRSENVALAQHSGQLEAVIAAARLGFCKVDTQTGALSTNSQFKAEFGWRSDSEMDWRALEERVACSERPGLASAVRLAVDTGANLDLVVQTTGPNAESQWIALQGRVFDEGDGRHSLILTSRNVSAERIAAANQAAAGEAALEQERRLRSEAQAANRGKDHFLSVFSHELRSPLNAILGWNRILALKRPEDPEVVSITARIEHSARAQLKMVNDLLDLARIETGKLRIEPRPMQLAKVVSAALDLARPMAISKNITLGADFEEGAGQLRADPDRLQQVVSNLLSNALKFTPSGGHINVRLRNVDGFTELCVQDTGQGIPSDLLPYVFDRFRQGDTSSTRQAGGLGLGLALVREIVTLHGGTVSAHSAGASQGATFVARFPARQPGRSVEPASESGTGSVIGRASLGGLSILVVDDEPDARTVVAETLKLEGARVTVSDSAMSAFEKLQESDAHFDIIVTDIGMPEEDGYSLVRRLRALQKGRQILAIAVTGYASNSDVEAALDAGFDLHVPKPVDFNTFVPMVRRLANSGR
jgi:signal transduction histidine kinase